MVSLKQRQSGFTIVELLIVIVIIGILATLVIVTFAGVQQKARDSERKTDINAIAGQLEAGYANKGYYPTILGLQSSAERDKLEIKIDEKAFSDPKDTSQNKNTPAALVGATSAAPTSNVANPTYTYNYYATGCSDTTATGQCTGYEIYAYLEGKDPLNVYSRKATN